MFPLLPICAFAVLLSTTNAHRISCYYRYNHRNLLLDQRALQTVGCTHVIISFATLTPDLKLNLSKVGERDGLKALVEEIKSPNRTIMLSFGGGGKNDYFDVMTSSNASIVAFVTDLMKLIRETSLDGVDYDWEFPSLTQVFSFSRLLNETREAFDEFAEEGRPLDLSVALPGPLTLTAGYEIAVLERTCTFFNVMTYDLVLYSSWRPVAAFHNALYGQGSFFNPLRLFSVEVSMSSWVNLGLPAEKLLLGIPTYGVAYKLKDPRKSAPLSAVTGYSPLGANLNHDHICHIIDAYPQGNVFNEQSRVPYATDNNGTWISYDNIRSVVEKVQFSVKQGYGGIMIFSLNADDPFGNCQPADNSSNFPLTRVAIATLRDALKESLHHAD